MDIVISSKETGGSTMNPAPSSGNHLMVRSLDTTSRRTDETFFQEKQPGLFETHFDVFVIQWRTMKVVSKRPE
jgi:hypothetical protein